MKKILIIGGTNFIGRNLVERLMHQGHYDLTLLNRGSTNANLFPNIKKITGDRNSPNITNLVKGNWDYVIDLSCYFPRSLEYILGGISKKIKRYIFISTCSVYDGGEEVLKDESSQTKIYTKEDWDDETTATYGKRKVACEELIKNSRLNYTILRPALVYGRYDHTDRFYYWLNQVNCYNKILVPNNGTQKFSITYIQDLITTIELSINQTEDKNIYNVISHAEISIAKIIEATSKLLGKSPDLINVSPKYLLDNNISEWVKMPLWINSNFFTFKNEKILKSYHLKILPFEKSIEDTIKYYHELNWPEPKYGIKRFEQLELINNYKN